VSFSDSWNDEPTKFEPYEPILTEEYWQGRRSGRMELAVSRLPGLAQFLRDAANCDPRVIRASMLTVAELIERTHAEAIGMLADDGRPVK